MSSTEDVFIGVVDDPPILRQGLVCVLSDEPRFQIVAEGACAREAVDIAEMHRPQIMLLDLDMPGGGISALRQISESCPETRCIVLSVCSQAEIAIEAINAGAHGYVLKGVSASDLRSAIWTVYNEQSFISPEFAAKLVSVAQRKSRSNDLDVRLNCREAQVIRELERGLSNKQIATKLDVSEKTVKYYMTSIMSKYGVSNRVSAVIAHQKAQSSAPELVNRTA